MRHARELIGVISVGLYLYHHSGARKMFREVRAKWLATCLELILPVLSHDCAQVRVHDKSLAEVGGQNHGTGRVGPAAANPLIIVIVMLCYGYRRKPKYTGRIDAYTIFCTDCVVLYYTYNTYGVLFPFYKCSEKVIGSGFLFCCSPLTVVIGVVFQPKH